MKRLLASLFALGIVTAPALAAPTTAQKDEFYAVCMGIAQDQALCGCKADAAMELLNERFMGVVISSMKGAAPKASDYQAYNQYVARSNKICKPNY